MMLSDEHRAKLTSLSAELSKLYGERLRGVYLYGSYARGEETPDSDLDILIVLDAITRYSDELERTGQLISDYSLGCDITFSRVFISESQWRNKGSSFLRNASRDAIDIFATMAA